MREVSHRWVITFNGEIYNHAELRAELETLGCNFATRSDTEVLINVVARVGRGGSLSAARNVRICAVVALAGNSARDVVMTCTSTPDAAKCSLRSVRIWLVAE